MKKIAILLATYNGEKYIQEQLDSILANIRKIDNTNYCVDIIVSDDNSSDKTIDIIKALDYSNLVILDKGKKGSAIKNFSFLIKNIDLDYDLVFFADQDDFWLPNKLNKFIQEFESIDNTKPVLIHSDLSVVDHQLFPISHSMFDFQHLNRASTLYNLIVQNSVTGCVMAINRELLKVAQNSNIECSIMHDWYLAMIAAAFGEIKFINFSTILYRQHLNNEVGAKEFNFGYLLNKIKNLKNELGVMQQSLIKTHNQAKLFVSDFEDRIDTTCKNDLLAYANSKWKRLYLSRKGFHKYGFIRNLVYQLLNLTIK